MDIVNELQYKQKMLDNSIKSLRKTGIEFAEAEKEYKMAVCKKALELRSTDMPVTLIQLTIYGYPEIASLRFKRDSAEAIYFANREAINGIKLEIKILQEQINKEYSME
jgi:hypothetical protein